MISCTLVFEGVDRVGKSSLLKLFLERNREFGYEKMCVPRTLAESETFYDQYFTDNWLRETPKVWDRGHISEHVYAPLYRPRHCSAKHTANMRMMELIPTTLPVVIVYVYPIWNDILKPDERAGANIYRELVSYGLALSQSVCNVIHITKHQSLHKQWRNQEEVLTELHHKLHMVLEKR